MNVDNTGSHPTLKIWSRQEDSNPQQADYDSAALPIELCRHAKLKQNYYNINVYKIKVMPAKIH